VIAFSGRALPDPMPEELAALGIHGPAPAADGASPAKYINSPESPIYTKGEHLFGLHQARHAIRQEGKAILVEGNFDVVSLHARGVGNVVAPLGTAFTTEQAKLLKRFAPDVVVLFDGDAAGRKATRAARKPCIEGQLTAKVAMLPSGLDPDELVRTRGVEALRHLLTHARGLPEQLIDDTIDKLRFAEAPASEQLRRVRAVQELIGEEPEKVVRESLISYAIGVLAKLPVGGRAPTEQSLQATLRLLETANPRHTGPQGPQLRVSETLEPYERARSKPRVEDLGLRILGTLLELPELLNDPEVSDALSVVEGDAALAIAALRQHLILRKGLYADEFLAQIPAPIHSFAAERLASSVFESGGDAKAELLINARKLRALSLSREKSAAVEQLSRVQRLGDVEAENALLREVERAARERRGMA
jgi:DNA primase